MSLDNLIREMDADDEIEITRADMVIKGNYRVTALFLQYYDELYEDRERQLQIDKAREQKALASNQMYKLPSGKELAKIIKSNSKSVYPKPTEIAREYLKSYGNKYDRTNAIEFTKLLLNGRRLTNRYRGRVLLSIRAILDKRIKQIKVNPKSKKIDTNRKYIKRDWDSLAREYLELRKSSSIVPSGFLKMKFGYKGSKVKYLNEAIQRVVKPVPVFSMSSSSSI